MNLADCWCCFGCGVILDQDEFIDHQEDGDGDMDAPTCPECGSSEVGDPW